MSRPVSHFYLDEYTRDLNFKKHYVEEVSFGIARMRGISIEEATKKVVDYLKTDTDITNPNVNYIGKNELGDRIRCRTTIGEYLQHVDKEKKILTATMVTIDNHKEHLGVLPNALTTMVNKRKVAKKLMFAYRDQGNFAASELKKGEQNNLKRGLNALSGSETSPYNIFHLSSGHPILTSTCRIATSTANSNNEKFLAGNRPYYNADNVIEDICHICCKSDAELVKQAISVYNLHIPTVDEIMEMIKRSTVYYWESDVYMEKIRRLVNGLTPEERVMVMYNGDLYHLTMYNPDLVRKLFALVINIDREQMENGEEPLTMGSDAAILLFAKSTMLEDLKGLDFTVIKTEHPDVYQRLCNTYHAIDKIIVDNMLLVRAFWVTRILPRDVGHFPTSYRKVGLLSDTDSTVFTTQYYLQWYLGKDFKYDNQVWSIAAFLTYLVSSVIQHYLAQISTNIGTDEEHRYLLSMKSEFLFGLLGLTGRGKHYYSKTLLQEGVVPKADSEWEIKGSALIASKISQRISARAHNMLKEVVSKKISNTPVYVKDVIDDVVALEKELEESIKVGNIEFLRVETIRKSEDYRGADPIKAFYYEFWQNVYGETYGSIEHLPYDGVRLTLNLNNKTKLNNWIESIQDPVIRDKTRDFLARKGKTSLGSLILPINNIISTGVPKELLPAINVKLTVANLMGCYYLTLDSFGLYITRNNSGKNIITIRDRMATTVDKFEASMASIYEIEE